jgi:hypothetical protein
MPQSPDLNLVEHLWNEVDCHMRMPEKKSTRKNNLWEKLQEIRYNIDVHIVRKLIISTTQSMQW